MTSVPLRAGVVPIVLAAVWNTAAAQDSIAVGDRIRVRTATLSTEALLTALQGDSLMLRTPRSIAVVSLPWADLTSLDASRNRTRGQGARRGAKWGAIVGAGLGLLLAVTPAQDTSENAAVLALDALWSFAVTGAAIGAIRPGKRWQRVNVQAARESARRAPAAVAAAATAPGRSRKWQHAPGTTPAAEIALGVNFPQFDAAQFPGLLASGAVTVTRRPRLGAAIVGEADASLFRSAVMGGARVYFRSRPLYERSPTFTWYGQLLVGRLRAERSGVQYSNGGSAVQPGVGVDFGAGAHAIRLEFDDRRVPNGVVHDERVTTGPIATLSGHRVALAWVYRFTP